MVKRSRAARRWRVAPGTEPVIPHPVGLDRGRPSLGDAPRHGFGHPSEFERAMIRERVTRRVTIAPSFELDQEHGAPL